MGYRAPEAEFNKAGRYHRGYTAKSDLWSIGRTILTLMNLEWQPKTVIGEDTPLENREPEVFDDRRELYSWDLIFLVQQCTQYEPDDRMSLEDAYKNIQDHVAKRTAGVQGSQMKFARLMPDERIRCRPDPYMMWAK